MIVLGALLAGAALWWGGELTVREPGPGVRLRHRRRAVPSRQIWLSQAGAAVTPRQFWAVSATPGVLVFLVVLLLDRAPAATLMPALAASAVPFAYWSAQRRQRAIARTAAWPEALRQVSGRLEAGIATLHDALAGLAESGPPALRPTMSRYLRLASRVGQRAALEAIRGELADAISDPIILTFEMAVEEGTDQVLRILQDLTGQIEGDLQLAERITTLQTQSRIATWAIFGVPYLLLTFLCAVQPLYRSFFAEPIGAVTMGLGMALSLSGLMVARRLGRSIPTTQRVFVTSGLSP